MEKTNRPTARAADAADAAEDKRQFVDGLAKHVGEAIAQRMWQHWQLVCEAQKKTNLTGIASASEALERHYLDALAALPLWSAGQSLLDVGSGAGFPGLVLALAQSDGEVTLTEPRRLRALFLQHAVAALGVQNVAVVAGKAERLAPRTFDCLTMRAVFAGEDQLTRLAPLAHTGTKLLIFRQGQSPQVRRSGRWQLEQCHRYGDPEANDTRRIDEWIFT